MRIREQSKDLLLLQLVDQSLRNILQDVTHSVKVSMEKVNPHPLATASLDLLLTQLIHINERQSSQNMQARSAFLHNLQNADIEKSVILLS